MPVNLFIDEEDVTFAVARVHKPGVSPCATIRCRECSEPMRADQIACNVCLARNPRYVSEN